MSWRARGWEYGGEASRDHTFMRGIQHGHLEECKHWNPPCGVELREHYNYPGWPDAKAKDWPVTTLTVAMPEGREDLQPLLRARLQAVVDAFIQENILDI